MAVFTPVDQGSLERLLREYTLGDLVAFEGISSGIENTNYFVDTTEGRFVLTLFEKLSAEQLPFYLSLMHHLSQRGIPCPRPMPSRAGALLTSCQNRPSAFVTRLNGSDVRQPSPEHCEQLGSVLARAHKAVSDFTGSQPNLRGLSWWHETVPSVLPFLPEASQSLLRDELAQQQAFAESDVYTELPRGAVHADLFRDNVLFVQTDTRPLVSGIIDFYFAGVDHFVFDLAVAANDWCLSEQSAGTSAISPLHEEALLLGYERVRTLTDSERAAWPVMLRAAALRFWISRLYDWHLPRKASMLTPKDPGHFERILKARRDAKGRT